MVYKDPVSNGVATKSPRLYGRRKGRPLRQSMKRRLDTVLPELVFDPAVSPNIQFGRHSDCYLEIGFGGGEHLAALAATMPDCDFIGAEPFVNGVASLLRHIDEQQLDNIRIWPDDVRLILPTIDAASLAGAFIMFPDPWPKNRHAKRRLITRDFLIKLHKALKENSEIHIATDSTIYVRFILNSIYNCKDYFVWMNQSEMNLHIKDYFDIETKYYKKAINSQRKPSLFILRKL